MENASVVVQMACLALVSPSMLEVVAPGNAPWALGELFETQLSDNSISSISAAGLSCISGLPAAA